MTVRISKPSFNIRERLSELERPIGLKGSELMKAETAQEARELVGAGRKNLVINGAMTVAQRSTSVSGITNSGYKTIDRQQLGFSPSGAVLAESRSTDAPENFAYSRKLEVTTAGTSSTWALFSYKFEGQDVQHLNYGSSNAKHITLSFWVKANHTGNYVVELINGGGDDRLVSYLYTINTANTWQKIEWTVPPDTVGTFPNTNGESLQITWFLAPGSIFTGGTRLTSWGARGSNSNRAVGCNQFTNTVGNQFYLTGVQLEVGKNATEFEHRSFGEELALCQRYYQRRTYTSSSYVAPAGLQNSTNTRGAQIHLPVSMRVNPTITTSGTGAASGQFAFLQNNTTNPGTVGSNLFFAPSTEQIHCYGTSYSTLGAVGDVSILYAFEGAYIEASAEL